MLIVIFIKIKVHMFFQPSRRARGILSCYPLLSISVHEWTLFSFELYFVYDIIHLKKRFDSIIYYDNKWNVPLNRKFLIWWLCVCTYRVLSGRSVQMINQNKTFVEIIVQFIFELALKQKMLRILLLHFYFSHNLLKSKSLDNIFQTCYPSMLPVFFSDFFQIKIQCHFYADVKT